jgi:rubrerythrin
LMAWITKIGIDQDRLFAALGIKGVEEIGIEHLETLTGLKTAIKDGDCSVEEAFPPLVKEGEVVGKGVTALQSKIEKKKQPKKEVVAEQVTEPAKNDLRMKWCCDGCGMFMPEKTKCPTCQSDKEVRQATEKDYVDLGYGK